MVSAQGSRRVFIERDSGDDASRQLPATGRAAGWQASLSLGFNRSPLRTVLAHRRHQGPLTVQRPFYPEGPVCHVYLLHPPGGVVGGDGLRIDAEVGEDAAALLTTPAATKFYRSAGPWAEQSVALKVGDGASLEWLPQETILYDGSRLNSELSVELSPGGRFLGWDIIACGRPASAEPFMNGEARLGVRITRDGQARYVERTIVDSAACRSPWGLGGRTAFGTLFAFPVSAPHLQRVHDRIATHPLRSATRIDELLICRAMDERADRIRSFFEEVWTDLRHDVIGRHACTPRIWAT